MRLLIVEDDTAVAGLVRRGLMTEGNTADVVHSGHEGLERAATDQYDAIIVDIMLPGISGLEVVRRLRERDITTPVLILTARDALDDRLRGFEVGADDYLPKPFAFAELLARLRAITRRGGTAASDDRLVVGDLVMDRRAHEVMRGGRSIHLSPKEYALLEYLMMNPGRVLSRTLILERIWDYGYDSFANVVDATIRRLRKSIDEGSDQPLIQTVRGVGYKIRT